MFLTATDPNGAPVVLASGAYLHGGRLRCPLLLVRYGNTDPQVTLRDDTSNQEFRVRLPPEAVGNTEHLRFDREPLEMEIL